MILYFTGTGNSKYVAQCLAENLNDEVVSINKAMKDGAKRTVKSNKPWVFVFPIYAWQMPKILTSWIENTVFEGNNEVYFIGTCGDDAGNTEKYIKKLSEKKDFEYKGTSYVKMPNNYIAMFEADDYEMEQKKLKVAQRSISVLCKTIKEGQQFKKVKTNVKGKINSSFTNGVFYKVFVKDKLFYAKDSCIGCGKCKDICPLGNIDMDNNKPKWKGDCTHCMGCISICPETAIEYGKKTQGKKRYYFHK